MGEHNHVGPGIRLMILGEMTYVLPGKTIIYKAGDFFFESGDVNHTVYNKTDAPNQHLLLEILPVDLKGCPSPKAHPTRLTMADAVPIGEERQETISPNPKIIER